MKKGISKIVIPSKPTKEVRPAKPGSEAVIKLEQSLQQVGAAGVLDGFRRRFSSLTAQYREGLRSELAAHYWLARRAEKDDAVWADVKAAYKERTGPKARSVARSEVDRIVLYCAIPGSGTAVSKRVSKYVKVLGQLRQAGVDPGDAAQQIKKRGGIGAMAKAAANTRRPDQGPGASAAKPSERVVVTISDPTHREKLSQMKLPVTVKIIARLKDRNGGDFDATILKLNRAKTQVG